MFFTPKKQHKRAFTEAYSTTGTQLSKRLVTQSEANRSTIYSSGSNKSIEKGLPITKMSIEIKRKKVDESPTRKQNQSPKLNPAKFRAKIQSKMSTQSHDAILAYGISSYKGFRNVVNPHHIGIHLGFVKNLMLIESYDGAAAGKFIKQEYPLQLMKLVTKELKEKPEVYIKEAYCCVQEQLTNYQEGIMDNSGASLASVIITKQLITVGNAGASQIICYTKRGSLLKLCQPHLTSNQKELDRIVKNGGRVYQSVVKVPNQEQLAIEGPIRLFPSGLVYTRALGRALDYKKEVEMGQNYPLVKKKKGQFLTWVPEVAYVKTDEVVWVGIFSENIIKNCSPAEIKDIISRERAKKSTSNTDHHIAMECSRKIVNKVIEMGIPEALSAIISFFSLQSEFSVQSEGSKITLGLEKKHSRKQIPQGLYRPVSFKYIGNRRSFVKEHTSHGKMIYKKS